VTIDAAPFNIQELHDFDRIIDPGEGVGQLVFDSPWTSTSVPVDTETTESPRFKMKGFSPIFVYNPNGVQLQYLVTMEYRCRFDIGHPASSTHTHHSPSSPATWAGHMRKMYDMGHGVLDIADQVARMGDLGQRALPYLSALPALMG
jgi:hypothetical protein